MELPRSLGELRGPTSGVIRLPHENRFITIEPETGAEMTVEVFSDI